MTAMVCSGVIRSGRRAVCRASPSRSACRRGVHDLAVDGGSSRTRMLDPGESQRLDLGRVTADIRALCTLSGCELAGMSLDVRVDER